MFALCQQDNADSDDDAHDEHDAPHTPSRGHNGRYVTPTQTPPHSCPPANSPYSASQRTSRALRHVGDPHDQDPATTQSDEAAALIREHNLRIAAAQQEQMASHPGLQGALRPGGPLRPPVSTWTGPTAAFLSNIPTRQRNLSHPAAPGPPLHPLPSFDACPGGNAGHQQPAGLTDVGQGRRPVAFTSVPAAVSYRPSLHPGGSPQPFALRITPLSQPSLACPDERQDGGAVPEVPYRPPQAPLADAGLAQQAGHHGSPAAGYGYAQASDGGGLHAELGESDCDLVDNPMPETATVWRGDPCQAGSVPGDHSRLRGFHSSGGGYHSSANSSFGGFGPGGAAATYASPQRGGAASHGGQGGAFLQPQPELPHRGATVGGAPPLMSDTDVRPALLLRPLGGMPSPGGLSSPYTHVQPHQQMPQAFRSPLRVGPEQVQECSGSAWGHPGIRGNQEAHQAYHSFNEEALAHTDQQLCVGHGAYQGSGMAQAAQTAGGEATVMDPEVPIDFWD